ncbi:MAG: NfeD family protein [Caldicoprobacterales bacterium]|jgi:membrane-bound serine protease (ClpP class)
MMHLILSIAGLDFSGLEGLIIILFILGIALVVIEMVMPGIGAAGILGIISLIAGVILAAQVVSFTVLILIILVVLLIITGMLVWLYKSAVKGGRVSRLLMLKTQTSREEGYSSTSVTEDLVGLEGITTTVLRPAGTGDFQGRKLDVVTDGEFIPKGTPIRITQVEGFRIVVEKREDKSSD